jgi:hypothetical protein
MPQKVLNLVKGDRAGADTDYRDALPINMTAVLRDIMGVQGYMIQYPGIKSHSTLSGKCRGGMWNERQSEHYRVNGNTLYKVDSTGAATSLGTISGDDTVSFAYSFNTLAIVADGKYYTYKPSVGLKQITDPDLGKPSDVVWVDNYYFFTDGESLFHTDATNEETIDPLKFSGSVFSPDPILGLLLTQDNKVAVFNRYTTEYFTNVATANFAFQRLAARALKIGIVGTHCKTELNGKFYILGSPKEESVSCYSAGVGATQKIATREVDKLIGQYTETQLSKCVVESYGEDGYSYVVYHLPNETLLFNETLSKKVGIDHAWTILQSKDDANYSGVHYVMDPRLNKWVVGDKGNGNVGTLDNTLATQYGDMVEWHLYSPFQLIQQSSIFELEVETLPGFNDQRDATVFVSVTQDGVTYSKQYTEMYGEPAKYGTNFILRRLGYVNDWVGFRLRGLSRSRMAFGKATITHG